MLWINHVHNLLLKLNIKMFVRNIEMFYGINVVLHL